MGEYLLSCCNPDCGKAFMPDEKTFWEATVYVRDRDAGGPNRRRLERTGRGLCPDCSVRVEYDMPQREALF